MWVIFEEFLKRAAFPDSVLEDPHTVQVLIDSWEGAKMWIICGSPRTWVANTAVQ